MRGGARVGSGPRPKLLADHLREGTFRRDRHGPAAGVRPVDGRRPALPPGLTVSMRDAWMALLDVLEAAELLDSADAAIYESFSVMVGRAREARALVDELGVLVRGAGGRMVLNPMIRVESRSWREVQRLGHLLGVGLVSREALFGEGQR